MDEYNNNNMENLGNETEMVTFNGENPYSDTEQQNSFIPIQEIATVEEVNVETDKNNEDGFCMAAAILGAVGFILNPLYIVSILAVIFGCIYRKKNCKRVQFAEIGIILGVMGAITNGYLDFYITLMTGGVGIFTFCC